MSVLQVSSVEDFQNIIQNNANVLMEFYASWCPHCKAFYPVLEQASTQLNEEGVVVAQTEIDTFADLANEFGVQSIPTLFFFKNGQQIEENVGTISEQAVLDFVQKGLNA